MSEDISSCTEITDWLEHIGFWTEIDIDDRILSASVNVIKSILRFTDITPEWLLSERLYDLRPVAIDYLADLCIDLDEDAFKLIIEFWSADRIRLMLWKGFQITDRMLEYSKRFGNCDKLLKLMNGRDTLEQIAKIIKFNAGDGDENMTDDE